MPFPGNITISANNGTPINISINGISSDASASNAGNPYLFNYGGNSSSDYLTQGLPFYGGQSPDSPYSYTGGAVNSNPNAERLMFLQNLYQRLQSRLAQVGNAIQQLGATVPSNQNNVPPISFPPINFPGNGNNDPAATVGNIVRNILNNILGSMPNGSNIANFIGTLVSNLIRRLIPGSSNNNSGSEYFNPTNIPENNGGNGNSTLTITIPGGGGNNTPQSDNDDMEPFQYQNTGNGFPLGLNGGFSPTRFPSGGNSNFTIPLNGTGDDDTPQNSEGDDIGNDSPPPVLQSPPSHAPHPHHRGGHHNHHNHMAQQPTASDSNKDDSTTTGDDNESVNDNGDDNNLTSVIHNTVDGEGNASVNLDSETDETDDATKATTNFHGIVTPSNTEDPSTINANLTAASRNADGSASLGSNIQLTQQAAGDAHVITMATPDATDAKATTTVASANNGSFAINSHGIAVGP